jgi:hypothetical protein
MENAPRNAPAPGFLRQIAANMLFDARITRLEGSSSGCFGVVKLHGWRHTARMREAFAHAAKEWIAALMHFHRDFENGCGQRNLQQAAHRWCCTHVSLEPQNEHDGARL